MEPFSPQDVYGNTEVLHPDFIRAVNNLLCGIEGNSINLNQSEIITECLTFSAELTEDIIRSKSYFYYMPNVYRGKNWKVSVDRPAYNESYETNYTFSRT